MSNQNVHHTHLYQWKWFWTISFSVVLSIPTLWHRWTLDDLPTCLVPHIILIMKCSSPSILPQPPQATPKVLSSIEELAVRNIFKCFLFASVTLFANQDPTQLSKLLSIPNPSAHCLNSITIATEHVSKVAERIN